MTDAVINDCRTVALGGSRSRAAQLRSLVAPTHAALLASGLNHRPFKLAALLIGASLAKGRQFVYVKNSRQLGKLYGFQENDISAILNGYDKNGMHVSGLIEAGIVRKEELPLDGGWLLVVNPDYSSWKILQVHSAAQKAAWLGVVDAQARELERQMVDEGIEAAFPDLTSLMSSVDVDNALTLAGRDGYVVASADGQVVDALTEAGPHRTDVVRASCRSGLDALNGSGRLARGPERGVTSEIPKSERAEKRGGFGNSEASRTRPIGQGIGQGIGTVQNQIGIGQSGMDRTRREELKGKITGDQREFCWAARQIIGDEAWSLGTNGRKPDAIRWTLRWKAGGEHRRLAVAVMQELMTHEVVVTKSVACAAENLWCQWGGKPLDSERFSQKNKESLRSFANSR